MAQFENTIAEELSKNLEIDLYDKRTMEELKLALTGYVNHLIRSDRDKLMHILYRVDVSERALKSKLAGSEQDAAALIADMIIERQLQKAETKKRSKGNEDISEEERW